ncbi:MAG: hypothetical protein O3C40_17025 [Planctomycetota bacterium]|nr:hypothetical protein [Planctomycetota bacterium]
MSAPEVVVGDRMFFYYAGWKKDHGPKDNEAAIGLATLPRDRFVAIKPQKRRGSLTTKPFVVEGEQLQINANASGGELRIEVLTEPGDPAPGYDAASCEPITTDELQVSVNWGDRSLKALKGKTIRLRCQLDQAELFAFQVQ